LGEREREERLGEREREREREREERLGDREREGNYVIREIAGKSIRKSRERGGRQIEKRIGLRKTGVQDAVCAFIELGNEEMVFVPSPRTLPTM